MQLALFDSLLRGALGGRQLSVPLNTKQVSYHFSKSCFNPSYVLEVLRDFNLSLTFVNCQIIFAFLNCVKIEEFRIFGGNCARSHLNYHIICTFFQL
jgi:hypothetical protein